MPSLPSVSDQWSAVFAAPVPFFLAVVAVATVVWGAMLWRYKGANEKLAELYDLLLKKAELQNEAAVKVRNELKETIASLKTQIEQAEIDGQQKDPLVQKTAAASRQLETLSEANNALATTLFDARDLFYTPIISVSPPTIRKR